MPNLERLLLNDNQISDAGMAALASALQACSALFKLENLYLQRNQISDAGVAALLEEGAMPNLKLLLLHKNQISDAGVAALASALRGGTLPSCTKIGLRDNPGGDAPVKEALALRRSPLYSPGASPHTSGTARRAGWSRSGGRQSQSVSHRSSPPHLKIQIHMLSTSPATMK